MIKWTATLVLVVAALVMLSLLQRRSLRHASLIDGMNQLRVAYSDYMERGYVTNYPTSGYRVWLSTNTVTTGGTQYQCFAEVSGGWGYDGGTLATTTNRTLFGWTPSARRRLLLMATGHRFFQDDIDTMTPAPNNLLLATPIYDLLSFLSQPPRAPEQDR